MSWRSICYLTSVKSNFATVIAFASYFGVVAGCNSVNQALSSPAGGAKIYAINKDSAAFYRYGPQQGNGPDSQLPKDTLVKLIRPSFGYSKVQLVKGADQGYVASEDLQVATPAVIAAATATPPPVAAAGGPRGERFDLNSNDPRLVPPPETLPAPDLPPSATESPSPKP